MLLVAGAQPALADMATGTYTGNGNALRFITGVGFQPAVVIIKGDLAQPAVIRADFHTGFNSKLMCPPNDMISNGIISMYSGGFTISLGLEVNDSGTEYHWVAFSDDPGTLATDFYTGDGAPDHWISGVGFQPEVVIVIPHDDEPCQFRTADMPDDYGTSFDAASLYTNHIEIFAADAFRVGSNPAVNEPGQQYGYVAFDANAAKVVHGIYTGDGAPAHDIGALGFGPEYVIVKSAEPRPAVHRPKSLGDPWSSYFWDEGHDNEGIVGLEAGHFTVGTSDRVNEPTRTYYYVAFNDVNPVADLAISATWDDPAPAEGQLVRLQVQIDNFGPDRADNITSTTLLPAGLTFDSAVPDMGTYDDGTGEWLLSTLWDGDSLVLNIWATVDAGTAGSTLTVSPMITGADQPDPDGSNNSTTASLTVSNADLDVSMSADDPTPVEGQDITIYVDLVNNGPDVATGVKVDLTFPAGLTYQSNNHDSGSYNPGLSYWTISSLGVGASTQLRLVYRVDVGTDGQTLTILSDITEVDQSDTDGSNNSASVDIIVNGFSADLAVAIAVDDPAPDEGQEVVYTVDLDNLGPSDATGTAVTVTLPAGLTYVSDTPGAGTYDSGSGVWTIGPIAAADTAQLQVTATVDAGTGGSTLTTTAAVSAADQGDPDASNNTAGIAVDIRAVADLELAAAFDITDPLPGDSVVLSVVLTNAGPDTASGIQINLNLPPELELDGADLDAGNWTAIAESWMLPTLAPNASETLLLSLTVGAVAAGTELSVTAAVVALDQDDQDPSDDTATASLTVRGPTQVTVVVEPFDQLDRTLLPGGTLDDVLLLDLVNETAHDELLTAITIANPITGIFDQATQDAVWSGLQLWRRVGTTQEPLPGAEGGFTGGWLTFAGLDLAVTAGDTLHLVVRGAAAVTAPDGLELRPEVNEAANLVFDGAVALQGVWPLAAPGTLAVDGMTAAQITLHEIGAEIFQIGSVRNLALDVTLPGNGGMPDELIKLNVTNEGTAGYPNVITRVEAWADDGNGLFNAVTDTRIGELHWTGGRRFEASALSQPVGAAGQRVFVTVDVAEDALGGTVRLSLPAGDDVGVGMASGNDGPIDTPVTNPLAQTVSATDRVIITTAPLPSRTVAPGEDRIAMLHLVARNLYADPRTIQQLRLSNVTVGHPSASQSDLDSAIDQLVIQRDGDLDGVLDGPDIDPVVVSTTWENGIATFENVRWVLEPDQVSHLFVTASVDLMGATDGDSLGAVIGASGDVQFREVAAVVGAWPLDSEVRYLVDGMVADQVACPAVPPVSLTANEGPVLALDLTVPGNGYLDDTLQTLRLANLGTATPADIDELGLYSDHDHNGIFEPGPDPLLAILTGIGQDWVALDVDLSIPAGGRRFFAGLTVASTPTDSATVRLSIPMNGLDMASANDGPRDVAIISPTSLLMSTAPLLSNMSFDLDYSTTEMTVTAIMHVQNVGGEDVVDITPRDLTVTGSGTVSPVSGPLPASLDLVQGAAGTFTWVFASQSQGSVFVAAHCQGIGAVGGQPRGSLASGSAEHTVLDPAVDLDLYPVANMPFSINRGQTGVVPLTLTLLNGGGPDRADLRLEQLVVTLDDGNGNPVVPADLLSHVTVNEGVNVYCDRWDLETSGQTLTLDLSPTVVVTASEPVTLGLRLDIRTDTIVDRFRIALMSDTDLTVVDNVSGQPRTVQLTDATFPVMSATGSIVSQATGLMVTAPVQIDLTAGSGQEDVPLLQLELTSNGDDTSSEVKVGGFAVMVVDTLGQALANAAAHLTRLWVEGPLAVHAAHDLTGPADSLVVFELMPQITVPAGAPPIQVAVHGRLPEDPVLGPLRLRLEPMNTFDARDGNNSASVQVTYQPAQIDGSVVTIQDPARSLQLAVTGELPPVVSLGARDVLAMTMTVEHPGPASSAAVSLDSLRLACLDINRQPQNPDAILDGLRVFWNGENLAVPVVYQNQYLVLPLGGRELEPFDQGDLVLRIDVEANAPVGGFELVASSSCLVASDVNLGTLVALDATAGRSLPASSGLARLQPPSDNVVAGWLDRLPPLLPIDDVRVEALRLVLTNPAPAGAAPVELSSLVLRAADRQGSPLAAGAMLSGVTVEADGSGWVDLADCAETDSTLILTGTGPLSLPAGGEISLLIKVSGRAGAATDGLSLGLLDGDVIFVQPGSTTLVAVRPAAGQTFPFWTAISGLGAAGLAESYINFPNPFAAGREQTSFAFNLPESGRVSLRIWTARGESVTTLLADLALSAGLHQDLTWDGRNGNGQTVRNGVYLAELRVEYESGDNERLLRKVAVVR